LVMLIDRKAMNRNRPTYPNRGFTLLELLCVIAVIAILAAMLLPALSQGNARARRVACVNYLHEIGVAFHSFAHDHNSQFPMNVPTNEGGSQEFVQAGYQANGLFYFAFHHFQTLSNELVTPTPLICPSDTRLAANSFGSLSNDNVSYFAGLKADYSLPNSILAGDRNITNDWTSPATILRLDSQQPFRWTGEMHRFKGNLLFADGRVEEWGSAQLATMARASQPPSDVALPSTLPTGPGPSGPNSSLTMSDSGAGPDNTLMPVGGGGNATPAPNPPPTTNRVANLVQSPYTPYRSAGPGIDVRGSLVPVSSPPEAPQTADTKPPVKPPGVPSPAKAVQQRSVDMTPQASPPPAPRLFSPQIAQVSAEEPEKKSNWLLYLLLILMGLSAFSLGAAAYGKKTQET
jgi:prepilin-type N-terminal cleavage/methylation domain-containing protein/prepilin-type processing-associated H-X9-DG protein